MRIIGGILGGRKIEPPAHMPNTRPTTDRAKEGLFNVLSNILDYESTNALDLFGGTGAISFELYSRGTTDIVIVEKDPKMYAHIVSTAKTLGIKDLQAIREDVFRFLHGCAMTFDFIFAGPPYALTEIDDLPDIIFSRGLLKPGGLFVLEHTPRNKYENHAGFIRTRNYGTTVFSFFKMDESPQ